MTLRTAPPPNTITRDQVERFLATIARSPTNTRRRDYALFLLMYRHGLRASEVGLLELADVDQVTGRLHVRRLKRGYHSWHPLQVDELAAIRRHTGNALSGRLAPQRPLFASREAMPIHRRTIDGLMKRYAAEAQLPADKRHAHVLRHSIATHLLASGADSRFVQDWLGQVSAESMVIYTRLADADRDVLASEAFARLRRA